MVHRTYQGAESDNSLKIVIVLANNIDSDEIQQYAALGIYMSFLHIRLIMSLNLYSVNILYAFYVCCIF